MDAPGRLDQIRQWATESEKRSGSPYVDERQQWIRDACDQLQAFADGVPNIIERRVGERRNVDRPDSEHPMRRVGGARRQLPLASDATVTTVTNALIFTSSAPPGMVVGNTFQLTWRYQNSVTGDVKNGNTPSFSTSDAGVATVSALGLITAVGAGTAVISAVGDSIAVSNPPTVTVSGSLTPDAVSPNPTSYNDVVGNTIAPLQFTLTDAGQPLTGRTPTAVSNDTGVVTLGAINSSQDPLHTVQPTLVGAGTTTISLGDSVVGVLGTVGVTAAASGAASAWLENNFGQYATINDLYLDGGAGKTFSTALTVTPTGGDQNGGEWQGAAFMSLGTDGGPTGGSTNYWRATFGAKASAVCNAQSITINIQFPATQTECWVEWYDRFSTNWDTHTTITECPNAPNHGYKRMFIRVNPSSRLNYQVFEGATDQVMLGYPNSATSNNEQQPFTNPTRASYCDAAWHRWRVHLKVHTVNGTCKGWFDNMVVRDFGTIDTSYTTNMYGISFGRTLNSQAAHAQPFTFDVGLYRVFIVDPGW